MRVCSACLAELLTTIGNDWTKVDLEDTTPLAEVCCSCHAALTAPEDRNAFFGTVYEHGQERADFFARYCHNCASDIETELRLQPAF
jgi:hypothetical protein